MEGWFKFPLRTCRTMHECVVCERTIRDGETYYDGGLYRRAHKACAEMEMRTPAKGTPLPKEVK